MSALSLYVDKGSFLNKLHPYTKLLYVFAAILIPLIGGRLLIFPLTILFSLILLLTGRVFRRALPLVAFSFTLIIVIFLIQGLFYHKNENPLFNIRILTFYREGVIYAAGIALNILNMLLSFAVFVLTTAPQDLVEEMEKNGFSPKFGYVINSVFQIVPQMMKTRDTIVDAQRSRGMETEGSLFTRIRAFLPLISPVVMSALINTRERAIALEVRGFGRRNKRSYITDRKKSCADIVISIILAVLILAVSVWRILSCLS
ncbi:MAG: energy-coupling factor transporter transmembrane protein EcfT [Lachnospiraceae bacterium]|nr:energy-coupling factor transporter transmembrane protein EcfT [Lachnospiraceae bacterium]